MIRRSSRTAPQTIQVLFWSEKGRPTDESLRTFANNLFTGAIRELEQIDRLLRAHAEHWRPERMPIVDRNILRLGVFELLHVEDVPPTVCINEAIELAKRFGDEESPKFINGILDAVHKASVKKRAPTDSPATTN